MLLCGIWDWSSVARAARREVVVGSCSEARRARRESVSESRSLSGGSGLGFSWFCGLGVGVDGLWTLSEDSG